MNARLSADTRLASTAARLLASAAVLACASSASFAQAPPRSTLSADAVLEYAGVYAPHKNAVVGISLQQTPFGAFPLLSDVRTGALRLLFPIGTDSFAAGPELARPEPLQRHVVFRRDAHGAVTGIELRRVPGRGGASPEFAVRVPLRSVPLSFSNGPVELHGTLVLPANGDSGAPAVVLAQGSEDSDRHTHGALAMVLAHHGFATFTFDKRGTGSSGGSWESAGIEELASDLSAAVAAVRRQPGVDSGRICVLGFSEGGWVAPRAAAESGGIACIVAISGGGRTKGDTYIYKNRRQLEERGLRGAALDSAVTEAQRTVATGARRVASGSASGFDRRLGYDPSRDWRMFSGPVLVLLGEADVLEDAARSAEWLRALFAEAGHPDATVQVFPGAHHGIMVGAAPVPSAFARMQGMEGFAPGYWETLLWWLTTRMDVRR